MKYPFLPMIFFSTSTPEIPDKASYICLEFVGQRSLPPSGIPNIFCKEGLNRNWDLPVFFVVVVFCCCCRFFVFCFSTGKIGFGSLGLEITNKKTKQKVGMGLGL